MNLLSIQSHVVYGHVGNSAAVFALQRLGCEVWPVHTVQFSNHTGYGSWTDEVFAADHISRVVDGIAARGALATCDGVLSGYLGSVATGEAILAAVDNVKAANAMASYCCDPVIGNRARGAFVRPGIAEFLRDRAVPVAEVVTPNHFELEQLAGRTAHSRAELLSAIDDIHALGPRAVLVTSVRTDETPEGMLDVVASDPNGQHLVRTERLTTPANGAGDLIAALFFLHYLQTGDAAAALANAASAVFAVLRRTAAAGSAEMLLVAAQDELVAPSELLVPQPLDL
jgi:pyridoxine kinase